MYAKVVEILEGSFAMLAFGAIVIVSVLSVLALNPQEKAEFQQVAGAFSENQPTNQTQNNPETQLVSKVIENEDLDYEITNQDGKTTFTFYLEPHTQGVLKSDFFEIVNFSNSQDALVELSSKVPVELQQNIEVEVFDGRDTLVLNSVRNGSQTRILTIPKTGSRVMNVNFKFLNAVNFPTKIEISLIR